MTDNPNPNPNPGNQDPNPNPNPTPTPTTDWKADLDPGIKDHPCLENFKDVKDVVKSYVSVQPLIGKEKIPIPGEKASKEEWDVVYGRLGRPASPNDYKLPETKLPEGFPAVQEGKLKVFREKAHELGLSAKQVDGIYGWYMGDLAGEYNAFNEHTSKARSESEVNLRQDWGKGYDAKIQVAKSVIAKFGDDNLKNLVNEGLGNDPAFIRFLASVGSKMSEDGMSLGRGETTLTPKEADMEIKKIQGDPKHPYFNKMHPEHQLAVQRMQDLFKLAHPEKSRK